MNFRAQGICMKCVLDSAVFINATSFPFLSKYAYVISSLCVREIKESTAQLRLETALQSMRVRIDDPSLSILPSVKELAQTHGVLHLTPADESVIALAMESYSRKEKIFVYTDDYSIQNVLKWAKIPFEGILQSGIQKKRSFRKKPVE